MKLKTGELDRRIIIQVGVNIPDENNDQVLTFPTDDPPAGSEYKQWAKYVTGRSIEQALSDNQMLLREADAVFTVRFNARTCVIAPEVSRILYKPRGGVMQIYNIIGVLMTGDRHDGIKLACSFRPDQQGAMGPIDANS